MKQLQISRHILTTYISHQFQSYPHLAATYDDIYAQHIYVPIYIFICLLAINIEIMYKQTHELLLDLEDNNNNNSIPFQYIFLFNDNKQHCHVLHTIFIFIASFTSMALHLFLFLFFSFCTFQRNYSFKCIWRTKLWFCRILNSHLCTTHVQHTKSQKLIITIDMQYISINVDIITFALATEQFTDFIFSLSTCFLM